MLTITKQKRANQTPSTQTRKQNHISMETVLQYDIKKINFTFTTKLLVLQEDHIVILFKSSSFPFTMLCQVKD